MTWIYRIRERVAAARRRHDGGALPVIRRERTVQPFDGTTYSVEIVWLRLRWEQKVTIPGLPRDVRRKIRLDNARTAEHVRRALTLSPPVKVGDLIPDWAIAFLDCCAVVRDSEFTMWKRAAGDQRYAVKGDGTVDRSQEYDWIAWSAGEWGGGWRTNEGMLDYAPVTVLQVNADAAA